MWKKLQTIRSAIFQISLQARILLVDGHVWTIAWERKSGHGSVSINSRKKGIQFRNQQRLNLINGLFFMQIWLKFNAQILKI